ncbi:hypothetical protein [Methylocella sp. CPCC 101449]|uniref:hypothetical protein n=1 Tax=Methylocella sp. CPCC 101449 TaxID=2987531 RepID=UPI00288CB33F|nr:hypothetical protein [Methylocella sp. CPCC 101449]MDT2021124.1 hypothetical protein [Methylocella sp. CPCC 101449]HEV2572428.1 hypothetical protein [Beijerinckiaceae bacterium]
MQSIKGPEREHLQHIDDALTNVVRENALLARDGALNLDVISNATVTLLLTVAAREALVVAEQTGQRIDSATFERLAKEALSWAVRRSGASEKEVH